MKDKGNIFNKVSAFIVGLNEGSLLKRALLAIHDLDEIIYVDLNSEDNSIQIAKDYNANVIIHERVPVVEIVHANMLKQCKNDWVLITDPDEVISESLKAKLIEISNQNPYDIGMIIAPIQFYFKDYKLKGTIWGGKNSRVVLVNKNRIKFSPHVHRGRQLILGFKSMELNEGNDSLVHHYWMNSYKQLIKKHLRYIRREGKSMYDNGYRTNIFEILKVPFSAFKECFLNKKGYKDGFIGFNLSLFWAWYKTSSYLSLLKYQRSKN